MGTLEKMIHIICGFILAVALMAPLYLNDFALAKTEDERQGALSRICALLSGCLLTGFFSILFLYLF